MRLIQFLALALLIAACDSSTTTTQSEASDEPMQWITMDGKPDMPHVVLVSGDEEYRSEEALPMLAKILSNHHGFKTTVLFAQDPAEPGIVDPNYLSNIPGLDKLADADMMILFTRFRALPDEQMKHFDDYLKSGKPLIGIRTATHAFMFEDIDFETSYGHYGSFYEEEDEWDGGFGRAILGEKWISHHGEHRHQSTLGMVAPGAEDHPVLTGIEQGAIWGPSDVYGVRLPLPGDSKPIVLGQVTEREAEYDENDPLYGMRPTDAEPAGTDMRENEEDEEVEVDLNDPMMPIAWTKSYQIPGGQKGMAFTSTIGASTDMLSEGVRRMFVNATYYLLEMPVPEKAMVDIIGTYKPTGYEFYEDDHWDNKDMKIAELAE